MLEKLAPMVPAAKGNSRSDERAALKSASSERSGEQCSETRTEAWTRTRTTTASRAKTNGAEAPQLDSLGQHGFRAQEQTGRRKKKNHTLVAHTFYAEVWWRQRR